MACTAMTVRRAVSVLALKRLCLVHSVRGLPTQCPLLSSPVDTFQSLPFHPSQCLIPSTTKLETNLRHSRSFSISQICWSKKKTVSDPGNDKEVNVFDVKGLLVGKMTVSAAEGMAMQRGATLTDMGVNADGVQGLQLSTSGTELTGSSKKTKMDKTKGEKEFRINAQITDHDLGIKLKNIKDTLSKGKFVKINITLRGHQHMKQGDKNMKGTFNKICQETEALAVVKMANKLPTSIIFQLQPKDQMAESERGSEAA